MCNGRVQQMWWMSTTNQHNCLSSHIEVSNSPQVKWGQAKKKTIQQNEQPRNFHFKRPFAVSVETTDLLWILNEMMILLQSHPNVYGLADYAVYAAVIAVSLLPSPQSIWYFGENLQFTKRPMGLRQPTERRVRVWHLRLFKIFITSDSISSECKHMFLISGCNLKMCYKNEHLQPVWPDNECPAPVVDNGHCWSCRFQCGSFRTVAPHERVSRISWSPLGQPVWILIFQSTGRSLYGKSTTTTTIASKYCLRDSSRASYLWLIVPSS